MSSVIRATLLLFLVAGCAAERPEPATSTASISAEQSLGAPAGVEAALRRACYDCHSAGAHPAWNARIAFTYWIPRHTLDALNFSAWSSYDETRRAQMRVLIAQVVKSGDMPPGDYRLFHPSGKLTTAETAAILAWTGGGA